MITLELHVKCVGCWLLLLRSIVKFKKWTGYYSPLKKTAFHSQIDAANIFPNIVCLYE